MKVNYLLTLILILTLIIMPCHSKGQENDFIRRKIENRNTFPLASFGEPIYCKQYVPSFYQNTFFELVWNPTSAEKLIAAISKAGDEGLNSKDYHYAKLIEIQSKSDKTEFEQAEFDMLLTDAYMLYISHLVAGKVNPVTVDAEWHVRKDDVDYNKIFTKASIQNIDETIKSVLPKHSTYASLKSALQKYRMLESDNWPAISAEKTIKPGFEDASIPLIRERLYLLGDLKDIFNDSKNLYDEKLTDAVKTFQTRHGITSDGEIGTKTLATINVSVKQRKEQIEANLERWRWLPQEFGNYYMVVNIANFELEVYRNKNLVRQHKVIVGKPFRRTPVFYSQMQYLVLNPTWTIPPGILNNDIIPSVKKDPNYLQTKKIDVLDNQGKVLNTNEIDWKNPIVKGYTYRQSPGPDNALGSVKFMFPNSFHVYLHDTSAKELFEKGERAYSSGCIRVQEPLLLAEYLLNDSGNYSLSKINDIVKTRKTETIKLNEKPNVFLLYWTAWSDSSGNVQFREDIYKRDQILIDALSQSPSDVIN